MTEKIGIVRNPLTVIAMFAGIAEVSGAGVLPFIHQEHQGLYIIFLMCFPTYLVTVFFLVLLFKHKVFYAPSDFKDDKSFLDILKPSPPGYRLSRINEEIAEEMGTKEQGNTHGSTVNTVPSPPPPPAPTPTPTSPPMPTEPPTADELKSKYITAEELSIGLLSKETGVVFKRDVQFATLNGTHAFDAAFMGDDRLHIVEVKYIIHLASLRQSIQRILIKAERFWASLTSKQSSGFSLTLIVVIDDSVNWVYDSTLERVKEFTAHYPYAMSVRLYKYSELQKLTDGS